MYVCQRHLNNAGKGRGGGGTQGLPTTKHKATCIVTTKICTWHTIFVIIVHTAPTNYVLRISMTLKFRLEVC